MAEFLLEIGIEELPARFFRKTERELTEAIGKTLKEANLAFEPLEAYAAPRQLTVYSRNVEATQADREETVLGPPVRIAYDDNGEPGKALLGFLKKNPALSLENLTRVEQKKGEVVAGVVQIKGRTASEILAEAIPAILEKMHFPKNMRWGHCTTKFVRPVRNLLAMFGADVIPFSFANIEAGNQSFGHRVYGEPQFAVNGIDHYLEEKKRSGVIVRHEDRKTAIGEQIEQRLKETGGSLVPDPDLLEEVADLVELPYVVLGQFPEMFLDIPKEVLVTSIREHQKSFTVQDESGALKPYFLSIANVAKDEKGLIKVGNERVLNARLHDAKFFWETDLKKDFEDLRAKLHSLVFQTKIGSYHGKTARMAQLATWMADQLGWADAEKEELAYATRHCKSDLVSDLVFEFPELQGMTGGLLLARQGKSEAIATAIYDHYLPGAMDDDLPSTTMGALISVADKIDTMTGCFAVGLIPTGSKDPYALRRAAQGVVRVLIEHELPFSLGGLLAQAIHTYNDVIETSDDLQTTLETFFVDRMRHYLKQKDFGHDLTSAVLARDTDRVDQTLKRAEAIDKQREKESFRTLALNLKRINNVIADEEDKLDGFNADLLSEKPELDLWQGFLEVRPKIEQAAQDRDYNQAMDLMTSIAKPVEAYFDTDGVYINVDDNAVRLNRKAMLDEIRSTFGLVADISHLE